MSLLALTKKKLNLDTLAAVCPDGRGMAVAKVRRSKGLPPVLEFCAYQAGAEGQVAEASYDKLLKKASLDKNLCISLVDFNDYKLLMVEAPDVKDSELAAAVRWRVKDLIDFNVEDAVIDVFEVPESRSGSMVYAVVARAEDVKKRIDYLLEAGLNLEIVDVPELALRNIAALLPEDVGGVALVQIGEEGGLITITRQQKLYLSRRLSAGFNSLPTTLMQSDDPAAIEAWLDRIVIEVQRSMDYYESHFSLPAIGSLVITPLMQEVSGIEEYISAQLDISTRVLDVKELIDSELIIDRELQAHCLFAIGAALREKEEGL